MTLAPPLPKAVLLIAFALLFGLGGACGPLTGDTPCTAGTCAGCCAGPDGPCLTGDTVDACGSGAAFCTACAPGDVCREGVCDGCTAHGDCESNADLCLDGACVSGYGRTYVISTVSASIPFHFDTEGVFACLYFDSTHSEIFDQGDPVDCTDSVSGTSNPSWNPGWAVPVYGESMAVWLYVWEERGAGPVFTGRRVWSGESFVAHARTGAFSDDLLQLTFALQ